MPHSKPDFSGLNAEQIEAKLFSVITESMREKYGENPPKEITKRVADEWDAMQKTDSVLDVAALYDIIAYCKENDYVYCTENEEASSLIFYLLGITLCNPLPPHSYCPHCKAVRFITDLHDGFDFPQGVMCSCGKEELLGNGHDIPRQMIWFPYKCIPKFEVQLHHALTEKMRAYTAAHWLNDFDAPFVCGLHKNTDCIVLGRIYLHFFHCNEAMRFNSVNISSKDQDLFFQCFRENGILLSADKCKGFPWFFLRGVWLRLSL